MIETEDRTKELENFGRPRGLTRRWSALLLRSAVLAALPAAMLTAQTTSTQFASGVTAPQGGAVLTGTGVNAATGQLFRHLWSADGTNGLCRLDPDIDTAGAHSINPATCVNSVAGGIVFSPGPLAFDPTTNDLYAVDGGGKNGIFRLHFVPSGDSGHGLVDKVQQEVVGAACGIALNQPTTLALGPDANLYVGFKRTGNIMRILAPQTEPLPCTNVQAHIATTSGQRQAQGLAWAGHELFAADNRLTVVFPGGDTCFTPINGNTPCNPLQAVGSLLPGPAMVSYQVLPGVNGQNVYMAETTSVTRLNTVADTLTLNYGGIFAFVSALAIDGKNPASPVLFVGDDPTNGLAAGQGRWFQVSNAPLAPAAPGTPTGVTAVAGDTVATVSWSRALDGQPVTSYTIHNSSSSSGVFAADVIVNATPGTTIVPTAATVTGLTDGVSYQFAVQAANAVGSSAFSTPSNTVVPQPITVPGAPANVFALAADAQAAVTWAPPPSNGNSPIISYTVTALVGGVSTGITATVPGNATGANVTGLTDGTTYTFTVHATNAVGSGAESTASNAVTPVAPPPPAPPTVPDLSLTMTGPASTAFRSSATYVLTVVNNGQAAAQVNLTDSLPAIGATFVSTTASQGTCATSGMLMTCQLGSMASGATASVTVVLNVAAEITSQASAVALDPVGNVVADPTPANNSASVTTVISLPSTTTDIQVTGAAQNGGPAHGTADIYTWQIKNGNSQVGNGVVFATTLPSSLQFVSASANAGGVCTTPTPGAAGGLITCNTASLPVGQTMTVVVNFTPTVVGNVTVSGLATFAGTDSNQANNSFSVTIGVK